MQSGKFKIKIYGFKVRYWVGSYKELSKLYKKHIGGEFQKDWGAHYAAEGNVIRIYFLKKEFSPGVVAHEAMHLLAYIYKKIHQSIDYTDDEHAAYLMQYIVENIKIDGYGNKNQKS